jgi:hypothetical protein
MIFSIFLFSFRSFIYDDNDCNDVSLLIIVMTGELCDCARSGSSYEVEIYTQIIHTHTSYMVLMLTYH